MMGDSRVFPSFDPDKPLAPDHCRRAFNHSTVRGLGRPKRQKLFAQHDNTSNGVNSSDGN